MDLSHLLFVGLVASAAVTTVGPKQEPATASLAAQVAPGTVVGVGAWPERSSAPCNPVALGRQVYDFCSEGTNPGCCDVVVAAVEGTVMPGEPPCLCQLEDDWAFLSTGLGINDIAGLYTDECRGLRPGIDRLVDDICHGDEPAPPPPPPPSQKPHTPPQHHDGGATVRTHPGTLIEHVRDGLIPLCPEQGRR